MTIKQQGGIFGRNPTFNNVTANDLTAEGTVEAATRVTTPIITNGATAGTLTIGAGAAQNTGANILMYGEGHPQVSDFLFRAGTTGLVRIQDSGEVKIINGNLRFDTAGTGIDFSATSGTGTSELFDDYEEGTWTPAFAAASGTFTTLTYSLQHGNYTKIGNTVRVQIGLATSEVVVGTASGNVTITGLPFSQSSTFNTGEGGSIGYMLRFATSMPEIKTYINHTQSEVKFDKSSATATSGSQLQVSDLTTGASPFRNYLALSIVYKTA